MSPSNHTCRGSRVHQHGFTLVELMVTVAIALFLLGGLLTVVQNVRATYTNQQALAQLQDEQRFALTVITDAVQAAGYFPDATLWTTASLPAFNAFQPGWVFAGAHAAGVPDTVGVRFRTAPAPAAGMILCDGTDTSLRPANVYATVFTVVPGVPGQLLCQVNNNAPVPIINGVQGLTVYYGVKRQAPVGVDYNVDTYLTWDQMGGTDWTTVTAVLVVLTFTNPLFGQTPNQPPLITIQRVIPVMARAGVHT